MNFVHLPERACGVYQRTAQNARLARLLGCEDDKIAIRWGNLVMLGRRLNDRIKVLCEEAVRADDGSELNHIFNELRTALNEHNTLLRNNALYPIQNRRRAKQAASVPHSRWVVSD